MATVMLDHLDEYPLEPVKYVPISGILPSRMLESGGDPEMHEGKIEDLLKLFRYPNKKHERPWKKLETGSSNSFASDSEEDDGSERAQYRRQQISEWRSERKRLIEENGRVRSKLEAETSAFYHRLFQHRGMYFERVMAESQKIEESVMVTPALPVHVAKIVCGYVGLSQGMLSLIENDFREKLHYLAWVRWLSTIESRIAFHLGGVDGIYLQKVVEVMHQRVPVRQIGRFMVKTPRTSTSSSSGGGALRGDEKGSGRGEAKGQSALWRNIGSQQSHETRRIGRFTVKTLSLPLEGEGDGPPTSDGPDEQGEGCPEKFEISSDCSSPCSVSRVPTQFELEERGAPMFSCKIELLSPPEFEEKAREIMEMKSFHSWCTLRPRRHSDNSSPESKEKAFNAFKQRLGVANTNVLACGFHLTYIDKFAGVSGGYFYTLEELWIFKHDSTFSRVTRCKHHSF
uniref:Uncharacterized protein n=1 Tax=Lotharella globosa TaxID=91324 RepID=A0A6U3D090_9EUKA